MHGFYHIPDRGQGEFFRNCYFWLKPYGRIFIHLVDKHKYNPVPLFAKPQLFEDIQNYSTTSDEQRGGFRGL
jgi:cyclopropane fatty-acyl-phospholipid synthase-like methyltransferase